MDRRATRLRAGTLPERAAVLGLDVGATTVRAAAVDASGAVMSRTTRPTPSDQGARELTGECTDLLADVLAEIGPVVRERVVGVGIAAIGPLDARVGVLLEAPNVGPGLHDVQIVDPIAKRFGLPVFLERDTNVAALGELTFGAARGVEEMLYLTVSTGVGGAIVTGGSLLLGASGVAGELGHVVVDMDGPICGCGHRGHLEAISSGSGIARAAREAVTAGRSPALAQVAERLGVDALSAVHVHEGERAGDPECISIMERACEAFAAAMVGFVDVFNPAMIVVGGSLAAAQGDRLLDPAREAVARYAFRAASAVVSIVPAGLGDNVGLIGAVPLVAAGLRDR